MLSGSKLVLRISFPDATLLRDRHQDGPVVHAEVVAASALATADAVDLDGVAPLHPSSAGMVSGTHLIS